MTKFIKKITDFVIISIANVSWKFRRGITTDELDTVKSMLIPNYYIILTHRRNHLSTFFVGLASFVLTGKWSYWAHVVMNMEDELESDADFRLVEATGDGVHYSSFSDVFKVHGVALLKPRSMSAEHWTAVMDTAKTHLGKPYDSLFDLKSDHSMSCVELVRAALMAEPEYFVNFANFEQMIRSNKNLTPQMFYDCPDFEVVYEIRRK